MSDEDRIRATYERYASTGRARLWDRSNRGYARLSAERDRALLELLRSSLPSSGGYVLDVGCGTGDIGAFARSAGVEAAWTGIDLLPDRIDAARAAMPDGEFIVGTAADMPFADDTFDAALAQTLFSSLPSPELEMAVANEIERVLRPGGWLIWYDLRYSNPTNPAVHGVSVSRLRKLFAGWKLEVRPISVAPPVARRLGRLTSIVYPLLDAVPVLRSHLVGRLRCPSWR